MTIRRPIFFVTAVAAVLMLVPLLAAPSVAADAPAGQIAQVNDQVLVRQDLKREMKLVSLKLARQGRPVSDAQLRRYSNNLRETLIERSLLLQEARAKKISVGQREVNRALKAFKGGFKTDKAYRKALADMGFSEEMFKQQIKDGLSIKALLDREVVQKVKISDKQVRAFYDGNASLFERPERVRASHILIKVPAGANATKKAEARSAIESLKARIEKGEKFAVLAQENSGCPSKEKGGDLGFFSREQMVPAFSKAAFDLAPGEISDVVETRFGYHLIRLSERQAAQTMAFNDVKESIAGNLRQEQETQKVRTYLEKLKKHADIKRFPL